MVNVYLSGTQNSGIHNIPCIENVLFIFNGTLCVIVWTSFNVYVFTFCVPTYVPLAARLVVVHNNKADLSLAHSFD